MGFYIPGPSFGKAEILLREHGATEIPPPLSLAPIASDKALICVVSNGAFEAAGYAFNQSEFEAFTLPEDRRPKRWFVIDRKLANQLTGYKDRAA